MMESFKKSLPGLAIILSLVTLSVLLIYLKSDRTISTEEIDGSLQSLHQVQDYDGSSKSKFWVELDNGEIIVLSPPTDVPFRKDKIVKVQKYLKESGRVTYEFIGYSN